MNWCRDCAKWLPLAAVDKNGLCRDHANERYRAAYAANSEPFKHRTRRRKAGVTRPDLSYGAALLAIFDGRCAYCPAPADSWDHVVAVTKGGRSNNPNFVPACRPCNSSKGNRDVWEWAPGRECHEALADCLVMAEGV
jgi:5-methylcytosine-specific restriction endonuclease McrA